MTIRASKLRAFIKIYLVLLFLVVLLGALLPWLRGEALDFMHTITMIMIPPILMAALAAFGFTPSEITWDEESVRINAQYPGSAEFTWDKLEARCPYGSGIFLLKFEGFATFQILSGGFIKAEWKEFASIFRARFPDKKTWFWFGVKPIRLKKTDRS